MFEQESYEYELKQSGQMNKKDFITVDMIKERAHLMTHHFKSPLTKKEI